MKVLQNKFKKTILDLVEIRCPAGKKVKYSNKYYLEKILLVLKDIVSWHSLSILYPNDKKYHYKTIQDVFLRWSRLKIFEDAYNMLINKYKLSKFNDASIIELFIDTADISNKYGCELAKFGQNKKKRVTKVSLICDAAKVPLSVTFYSGNTHDVTTIKSSLKPLQNIKYSKIKLIGDKGYISSAIKNELLKTNIELVTYAKRNQIIKNTHAEVKLLANRYKVEHANQILKDFNRVYIRRDKLIITYKSFVFLGLLAKFF